MKLKKNKLIILLVACFMFLLAGCNDNQANRVSNNLSEESDNFNTVRRITVINAIKNDVIFTMTGRLSVKADTEDNQLEIVVENKNGQYQKHIIGLSDNVSYTVEDITKQNVSKYQYEINYNPKMWVPAKPVYKD